MTLAAARTLLADFAKGTGHAPRGNAKGRNMGRVIRTFSGADLDAAHAIVAAHDAAQAALPTYSHAELDAAWAEFFPAK